MQRPTNPALRLFSPGLDNSGASNPLDGLASAKANNRHTAGSEDGWSKQAPRIMIHDHKENWEDKENSAPQIPGEPM